ncbi:hypothetical protein PULV_a2488 [Pseudoalteromonas ulvae UL12]|uniref:Serine protease n=1 Tax=Pseudoalteromonas ulvae TaxID=107327 RepID=A0A2C9ZZE9_PSEDV|nr:S8 family serine peptidase [Pseudoalteromonas ulvae]MBE0364732.1 hypothetical protein [Pseudoalteromonas ulvae UL12]OUL56136.1 serine protease [Pseudoalteromonas ulvae]
MSQGIMKKSAIALAVTSVMLAAQGVSSATFEQYNKKNQKPVQAQASKKDSSIKREVQSWVVKLNGNALAQKSLGGKSVALSEISSLQTKVETSIQSMDLDLTVLARTSKLVNSIIVKGDQDKLEQLLALPEVDDIYPVYDFELDVADSADYVKATPLVAGGIAKGAGVKVAVLDTGVDYTHAAFGGAGTEEAYAEAVSDPSAVVWPQGQVKGGYDYVNYDADPIDVNTNHGTHVSHSVTGIAPDVDLYVYSVCNSGCSGLAQILALENAMDPNNDGDIRDRVDVVNMSLGGDYGDKALDAVGLFINQAVKLGTNLVISAGNDGAYPFIVGGPSTTENALSVGAMTHPTDQTKVSSGTIGGEETVIQPASFGPNVAFEFSNDTIEVVYPSENQTACTDFADGIDFTGKAVVIDRGACAFVTKVLVAQAKGAAFVIIANNTDDGTPAPMGGSSDAVTIPSVGVNYAAGMALKAENPEFNIKVELKNGAGAIASFTSRGPSMDGYLKPEITAPGVNIMTAHPGLGDGLSGATGTSFSGPITAGAMSLLKEALPERNALELKATLMNAANLDVTMEPREINPDTAMAPISYIGSGLVDVEKAAMLPVAAWAKDTKQAALSFGLVNISETTEMVKTVEIKNFSNDAKTYDLSLEQRFADDVERGALSMTYPASVTVPAGQTVSFDVVATIDPAKLPEWMLDSSNVGSVAATELLTTSELDGALNFSEGGEKAFHLVYHVLPKAAASVSVMPEKTENGVAHMLTNTGAVNFEPFFAPTVASDDIDGSRFDLVSASIETIEVPSTFCDSGYAVFTTFVMDKGITHTYVAGFMADFDLDQDGVWDVTAQAGQLEWFYDVEPGTAISFTHAYGSTSGAIGNAYHTVGNNFVTVQSCLSSFGLTAEELGKVQANVRFRTEEYSWTPIPANSVDDATALYTFAISEPVAGLVNSTGNQIEMLAPGESAELLVSGAKFTMLSDSGSKAINVNPMADVNTAPVLANAEFSVDENASSSHIIGHLEVSYDATLANPVSEYILINSTSSAVTIDSFGGFVYVANPDQLDYDAGLTKIELEVVAVDTRGNVSESAMITVNVNNLADEASELPQPPKVYEKSSGSLGWFVLLAAPFAWLRRRKQK